MFYPSSLQQTRKPCRGTQTPRGSAKKPNRSFLTGDSDNDSDDDHRFDFPPVFYVTTLQIRPLSFVCTMTESLL